MPHQCLKCGILFAEGSTTILRGCPECRGTRFFFTQEPLAETEREKLLKSSEVTLRDAIEQLVAKAKDGALSPKGVDWVEVPAGRTPIETDEDPTIPEAPVQRVNFATILDTIAAPAPPPKAPIVAPVPAPPPAPRARMLPGNRLLVQVSRAPKRKKHEVRWEYEAPTPPPSTTAPVVYKKEAPPAPAPVAVPSPPLAPEPTTEVPEKLESPRIEPVQQTLPLVEPPSTPTPPSVAPSTVDPVAETPLPATATALDDLGGSSEAAVGPAPVGDGDPETIRIAQPGKYEIDVKRLLEDSPIVVQRDGTYLIHLPSLFDSNTKQRR